MHAAVFQIALRRKDKGATKAGTHNTKQRPPNTPSASGGYARDVQLSEMTEEGQKAGSLELRTPGTPGWSIQGPMQHRTLDMQDVRANFFSSTGSVATAQTSFPAICSPGSAPASIPGMRLLLLPLVPQVLLSPRRQVVLWVSLSYAGCLQP